MTLRPRNLAPQDRFDAVHPPSRLPQMKDEQPPVGQG